VGIIRQPMHVFIHLPFLATLDRPNLLSGFAEMLKAGLIADKNLWIDLKSYDFDQPDQHLLESLIWRSVMIKKDIVEADPDEAGLRKSLNFGHTIGHAMESEALHSGNPVPHGFAVAWGMVAEARLSSLKLGLPADSVNEIRETVNRYYGKPEPLLQDPARILPWMRFDKKNSGDRINFTLLEEIGRCRINCTASEEEILRSLKVEIRI
jgi:3-dehydroquinate synthase